MVVAVGKLVALTLWSRAGLLVFLEGAQLSWDTDAL